MCSINRELITIISTYEDRCFQIEQIAMVKNDKNELEFKVGNDEETQRMMIEFESEYITLKSVIKDLRYFLEFSCNAPLSTLKH